jgi:glucose-1-phosphate cytidylyltransferase
MEVTCCGSADIPRLDSRQTTANLCACSDLWGGITSRIKRVRVGESMTTPTEVPVFILAGGLGTRLKEHTEFRPKPMVEIGNRPILWHIMRCYAAHGFKRFIVCAGFKSEVIKDYFLNYDAMNSDFTVNLSNHDVRYHGTYHDDDWKVTVAYTGETTMTGARISRAAAKYLGNCEHFAVTYGDGLCDANFQEELKIHVEARRVGTVLGVNPPSRFGELRTEGQDSLVCSFVEKPELRQSWINGGYFMFRRDFMRYLSPDEDCVLEKEPLSRLTADRQLGVYNHSGFWACMDTQRDKEYLDELWGSGRAPWTASWLNQNKIVGRAGFG